jgi:hypothetical protein
MSLDAPARRVVVAWDLAAAFLVSLALPLWVTLLCVAALVVRWILVFRLRQASGRLAGRAVTAPSPPDRTASASP